MGYMMAGSTLHVVDSDTAADLAGSIENEIVKLLKKELNQDGGGWNTDGIINVAMVANELCTSKWWQTFGDDLSEFISNTVLPKLRKYIEREAKRSVEDWDGSANKQSHLRAYRKILAQLEKNFGE